MAYGDYKQSWERVLEGPKPEGPPVYMPTTEEVREFYSDEWDSHSDQSNTRKYIQGRVADFDRWLASVRADAWDEGNRAHPKFGVNPYRSKKQ